MSRCSSSDEEVVLSGDTGSSPLSWRDERLAALWSQDSLCDVEVVVSGEHFRAHRIVLAAASEFMAALLSGGWRDSTGPINLSGLDHPADFAAVLEWIYKGKCTVREKALSGVLHAAAHLQTGPLQHVVQAHVIGLLREGRMDPIPWWQEGWALDMGTLCEAAKCAALARFEAVAASPSFLSAPEQLVCELLRDDRLVAPSEEFIFESLLRWARAHQLARLPDCCIAQIRFARLLRSPPLGTSDSGIEHFIGSVPELRKHPRAKALIAQSFKKHSLKVWIGARSLNSVDDHGGAGDAVLPVLRDHDHDQVIMDSPKRLACLNWLVFGVDTRLPEEWEDPALPPMDVPEDLAMTILLWARMHVKFPCSHGFIWANGKLALGISNRGEASDIATKFLKDAKTSTHRRYKAHVSLTGPQLPFRSMHCRPRIGAGPSKVVLIGGDQRDEDNSGFHSLSLAALDPLECWDPTSPPDVDSLGRMERHRSALAAVIVSDGPQRFLYVIGGTVNMRAVDTVECWLEKPNTGQWQKATRPPLPDRRAKAGAIALGANLYVLGGRRSDVTLNGMIMLEACGWEAGWQSKSNMLARREAFGVAALDGHIYAIGGFAEVAQAHTLVERYSPQADTWEAMAPLPSARSALCAVALNGRIYAIGGFDGLRDLRDVHRYDPRTNEWTRVASLLQPRSGAAAVVIGGHIYIVGGYWRDDEDSRVKCYASAVTAERYDEDCDSWEAIAADQLPHRSYHAAVAI